MGVSVSKLSLMQESLLRQAGNTILMYGGASYGVKVRAHPTKTFRLLRIKLLRSSSKQSRMIKVYYKVI